MDKKEAIERLEKILIDIREIRYFVAGLGIANHAIKMSLIELKNTEYKKPTKDNIIVFSEDPSKLVIFECSPNEYKWRLYKNGRVIAGCKFEKDRSKVSNKIELILEFMRQIVFLYGPCGYSEITNKLNDFINDKNK